MRILCFLLLFYFFIHILPVGQMGGYVGKRFHRSDWLVGGKVGGFLLPDTVATNERCEGSLLLWWATYDVRTVSSALAALWRLLRSPPPSSTRLPQLLFCSDACEIAAATDPPASFSSLLNPMGKRQRCYIREPSRWTRTIVQSLQTWLGWPALAWGSHLGASR